MEYQLREEIFQLNDSTLSFQMGAVAEVVRLRFPEVSQTLTSSATG
jgi:hypothetical protein